MFFYEREKEERKREKEEREKRERRKRERTKNAKIVDRQRDVKMIEKEGEKRGII